MDKACSCDKETDQKMEEKGRSSSELSRAFTSPSGSSSRDRSQKTEMESSSIRANAFQGPTSQDSRACQRNPLRTYSQANMQLAPMESIHGHGSSSKAATKEQGVRPIKHIDSPRPQYRFMPDKPKASTLYESPRSIDSGQNMGPASSAKRIGATRDSPRLSFDERESRGLSKPSPKFELPRLSLDSRRQAITRTNSERNTNIVPTEQQTERDNSRRDANLKQEPQSHRPIYNVVAKLMGLEAPPDYTPVCGGQILPNKFNIDKNINTFSRSSRSISERELSQLPYSPRNCLAYSLSPWPRDANPRTSSGSAPLNQWEEHNGFDKPVHKHHEDNKDPQSLSVSIYGEIEKRLSELDFQNSGTDLRALKRILEATTRSKLIAKQETQAPDKATPPDSSDSSHMSSNQGPRCVTYQDLHRDCQIPITSKRYNSTADIVPPPMATKQDKLRNSAKPVTNIEGEAFGQLPNLRRLRIRQPKGIPDQGTKQTPTKVLANNPHVQDPLTQSLDVVDTCSSVRKVAPSRSPKLPKHIITDKSTSLNKSKGTKRNLKLDNLQHQAPASPSYSIKITHHNVKPMESDTFPRRIKRKEQNGGDISTKASQGSTWPSQQGKVASPRKINMDKQIEPAVKNEAKLQTQTSQQVDKRENSVDGATLKIKTAVQEQPSPVSILDAAFYEDESPSPVKRKSLSFKGTRRIITATQTAGYTAIPVISRPISASPGCLIVIPFPRASEESWNRGSISMPKFEAMMKMTEEDD